MIDDAPLEDKDAVYLGTDIKLTEMTSTSWGSLDMKFTKIISQADYLGSQAEN